MNTSLFRILWQFSFQHYDESNQFDRDWKKSSLLKWIFPVDKELLLVITKGQKKKWWNDVSSFRLTVKRQIGNSINQPLRRLHQVRVIDVNHKVSLLLASKIRKPFKRHERKTSYTFFKLSGTLPGIKKSSFFFPIWKRKWQWVEGKSVQLEFLT